MPMEGVAKLSQLKLDQWLSLDQHPEEKALVDAHPDYYYHYFCQYYFHTLPLSHQAAKQVFYGHIYYHCFLNSTDAKKAQSYLQEAVECDNYFAIAYCINKAIKKSAFQTAEKLANQIKQIYLAPVYFIAKDIYYAQALQQGPGGERKSYISQALMNLKLAAKLAPYSEIAMRNCQCQISDQAINAFIAQCSKVVEFNEKDRVRLREQINEAYQQIIEANPQLNTFQSSILHPSEIFDSLGSIQLR